MYSKALQQSMSASPSIASDARRADGGRHGAIGPAPRHHHVTWTYGPSRSATLNAIIYLVGFLVIGGLVPLGVVGIIGTISMLFGGAE